MGRGSKTDETKAAIAAGVARVNGLLAEARDAGRPVSVSKLAEAIGVYDETMRRALRPGSGKFPDSPEFAILFADALGDQLGREVRPEELLPHFARYAAAHPKARLLAAESARRMRGCYGDARRDRTAKGSRWQLVDALLVAGLKLGRRAIYEMVDGDGPFPDDRASLDAIAAGTGIHPRLLGADLSEAEQFEPLYRLFLTRKYDTLNRHTRRQGEESAAMALVRKTGKVDGALVPVLRRVVEGQLHLGRLADAAGIGTVDRLVKLLAGLEKPTPDGDEAQRLRRAVGMEEHARRKRRADPDVQPAEPGPTADEPTAHPEPEHEPATEQTGPAGRPHRPRGPGAPEIPPSKWHGNALLPAGWSDTDKWKTLLAVLAEANDWMTRKQLRQALQEKLQCSPATAYKVIAAMAGEAQYDAGDWFAHPEIMKDLPPPE